MKARSVKAKGRRLQNMVRDLLRKTFPDLDQDDIKSQTMGMTGEDIVLSPLARKSIPYSIECKNQEKLQVWKFLKQAEDNVHEDCDMALVIKRNGTKPYVVLDLDHWIELIKK
tara:strand:- start:720 stop:1058 length:339 start_codon:yes stop_codon:yes gene_type:complete